MRIAFQIKTALSNLIFSPFRSFLAMLGCMIGTASVVALMSSGDLAAEKAMELYKSLGTGQMSITFNQNKKVERVQVNPKLLTNMKLIMPEIKLIAPYTLNNVQVAYQNINFNANLIGSTPELAKIIKITLKQGRFFSSLDKNQNFCVIGQKVLKKLKIISPLGLRIKLGKSIFTIIGVADTWPDSGFFSDDVNESIFVPLNLIRFITSATPTIGNSIMELKENTDIDFIKTKINKYFAKYFPGYFVTISSAKELIKSMNAQQENMTLLLTFIGGIALFVAGIGIMNIMLASVSARRNEIGLRLAIGAQPKDIQVMFLMEAIILAIIGGGIGVLIGIVSTYFIALYSGWTFAVFLLPPVIGFSFSVLISMFFGYYPAYIASKLNPIEALKAS